MSRYRWCCAGVFALFLTAVAMPAAGETVPQPFQVGVVLPLSGDLASLGLEAKRGMQLALNEVDASQPRVRLLFEDDRGSDSGTSVKAAQKLLHVDRVDLGVTLWLEDAKPMAPLFQASQIPLVVLWDSNQSIRASGAFVFSNGFSTEAAGADMASFAAQHLKAAKAAILNHDDAWGEIIRQAFTQQFQALGGRVVYAHAVPLDQQDFKPMIAKMRDAGADAFYVPMLPPGLVTFLKQVRDLNVEVPLMTGDAFIQDAVQQGGAASEAVYMTNLDYPETSRLQTSYRRTFGAAPIDLPIVACGYDGMQRILDAIKVVQKGMPIQQALLQVLGAERTANRREAIFQVENGQRKRVDWRRPPTP